MRRLYLILTIAVLLLLSGLPSWAVTAFTAANTGGKTAWNDGGTWNKTSPGVEGTDFPGNLDTFTIPTGKTVAIPAGTYPSSGGVSLAATNEVQLGGTLTMADTAYLNTAGDGVLTVDGTLNAGAVGAGITGHIFFTPATDGGAGLVLNGTGTIVGLTKTHFVSLAADCGEWAASGDVATVGNVASLTVDSIPVGWLDHDIIVRAPTGRNYLHWDACRLNGAPSTTTVAVEGWHTAAQMASDAPTYLTGDQTKPQWNAQGQGTPTQARAEVLNLTRSFKIYSTDATKRCYFAVGNSATTVIQYVEFYSCGTGTAGKRAVTYSGSHTAAQSLVGSVVHDSAGAILLPVQASAGIARSTFTNDIIWNTSDNGFWAQATAAGNDLTNCFGGNITGASKYAFNIADVGSTFPGCRAVGNVAAGFLVAEASAMAAGILDNAVSHSNGLQGLYWNNTLNGYNSASTPIGGFASWRNGRYGIVADNQGALWFTSPVLFGNVTAQINNTSSILSVTSPTHPLDASYSTPFSYCVGGTTKVFGGSILSTPQFYIGNLICDNTTWGSFAAPSWNYGSSGENYLLSFRHNTAANDNRLYFKYGSQLSVTTTAGRHTQSGLGWLYQPSSAGAVGTWFRPYVYFWAFATANKPLTLTAWVKEMGGYDGTNPPRIVALGGYLTGVAADVVGSSWSGTPGTTWTKLTVMLSGANLPTETGNIPFVVEGEGTSASTWYVDDLPGRIDDSFGVDGWAVYVPAMGYQREAMQ